MNTKKLTLALMGATLLSANALAAPELVDYDVNGDGTTADGEQAYKITSADDLYWFAGLVNGTLDGVNKNAGANAFLANNIVVNENVLDENGNPNEGPFKEWAPIGNYDGNYTYYHYEGTFDGNGNTISGLYFSHKDDQYNMGLFGNINSNATIKNLGVIDSYFYCKSNWSIGGVCGYNNGGTIENCYSTSRVSGNEFVGGVCGENNGTITNCYSTSRVSGNESVGGVCGENWGPIINCYDFKVNGGTINGYSIVVDNNKITLPADVTLVGKAFEGWYENDNYEGSAIVSEDAGFGVHTLYAKYPAPTQITADNYDDYNLTEDYIGYYAIGDAYDLYWFANYVNKGGENAKINGVLVDNIVVNENVLVNGSLNTNAETVANFTEWFPIGYFYSGEKDYVYYKGTFDGNGKTVSGLYFNDPNTDLDGVGLFGNIESPAVIKNVGVIDSYFNGRDNIASVCGYNYEGTIENCYNTSVVNGNNYVGGVFGYNEGTITNCYNTGSVKGSDNNVGGVCGKNYGAIENCYNIGSVSGDDESESVGGVCGANGGTIINCYDFKVNGGTINGYSIVVNGGNIALPNNDYDNEIIKISRQGYTFKGWYDNEDFNGNAIESEVEFSSTESESDGGVHTLYAKWVENSTPTAIKAVEAENNDKTIKTIKDGQIVIIRNGVMYDLQGRKL